MHHWAVKSNLLTVLLPYPTLVCLRAWPKLPCYAGYVKATAYNVGIFWGKQKLPWLHTIFDFITQVDWQEYTNYNTWSRCRAEKGDGRWGGTKKNISLFPTPPLPLMSHPTASTILEFSIVVTQTKTITHEEKTPRMLGTWKHIEIIFKVVVMSSVLKSNDYIETIQPTNTNFNRNLSQKPDNNFIVWIQNNWFPLI